MRPEDANCLATSAKTEIAPVKSLVKKSITGTKASAAKTPNLCPKSCKVALSLLRLFCAEGALVSISLNFLLPSSIIALTNACLRSNSVKSFTALPISLAYALVAGSSLVNMPSSSKSSGSSFAAPLVSLSKASDKFLPKATETLVDILASCSICLVLKPVDKARLAFSAASPSATCP